MQFQLQANFFFFKKLAHELRLRAVDIRKNVPNLQVGESVPAPLTPPVIWVVLLCRLCLCRVDRARTYCPEL